MIVARASNRVIVGAPLCRNQEYLERCIMYTKDLNDSGQAINRYPWYLKPYESLIVTICATSYTPFQSSCTIFEQVTSNRE